MKQKQTLIVRRIIILLLLFAVIETKAQERDHFRLFTDRDLYVSGETILFKLFVPEEELSEIIKVDLINTGGKIISEVNKKISDHQANGFIYITDSLKTGTYLLCITTGTNQTLAIKELMICNRFSGLSETTSVLRTTGDETVTENTADIQIEGIGEKYKPGEIVHLRIHLSPEILSQIKDSLSVAAAYNTPGYLTRTIIRSTAQPNTRTTSGKGISVEGMARDLETGAPFKNGCIYLSIPDSVPDLQYIITGEDGHFNFQLDNQYGKIPIVVQGFDMEKKRLLRIAINRRDSITDGLPLLESRSLSADLQKIVGNHIEATTLSKIFNYQELNISTPIAGKQDYPFYGVPTEIVRPALFVDLADFTEISRELLPGVKFRTYNRLPTLQILNPATLNFFNEPPLVLLDGIPVLDLNVIKNMGSKDISRIEICRRERFYGDLCFAGVIAIFSSNQAYQRLAESNDLIKLNLDAMQPDAMLFIPKNKPVNEPNLRKILLWKPTLKPAETIQVNFETSDIRGSYQLIVRGRTKDGVVVSSIKNFEVD